MAKNTIFRISLAGLIAIIGISLLVSSSRMPASPAVKNCKESMEDCCRKCKDADTNNEIDFESLSGKFFSSLLID